MTEPRELTEEEKVEAEFKINKDGWKLEPYRTETLGSTIVQAVPSALDTKRLREALIIARTTLRATQSRLSHFEVKSEGAEREVLYVREVLADCQKAVEVERTLANDWATSLAEKVRQIDSLRSRLEEAEKAIMEHYAFYTYGEHPNEDGFYTCSHCREQSETRDSRFPHTPHCIVLKIKEGTPK